MISFPPSSSEPVLVIGASGMLGRELVTVGRKRGKRIKQRDGSAALDITCRDAVYRAIHEVRPSVVINTAGYTDVDGAECEFEHALSVNGDGPGNLARACVEIDALLVHFSSDHIFNGNSTNPIRVDEAPDPVNSYGLSMLAGEKAVIASDCRHLIVRTSWLFAPHGRNFVNTILRLARQRGCIEVVHDQRGRPTSCTDLADMTFDLLDRDCLPLGSHCGRIVHATNSGRATWYELAQCIVRAANLKCEVRPCTSESRLLHAPRPACSVLDLAETVDLIGRPRHWREALRECLERIQGIADPQPGRLEPTPFRPNRAPSERAMAPPVVQAEPGN